MHLGLFKLVKTAPPILIHSLEIITLAKWVIQPDSTALNRETFCLSAGSIGLHVWVLWIHTGLDATLHSSLYIRLSSLHLRGLATSAFSYVIGLDTEDNVQKYT